MNNSLRDEIKKIQYWQGTDGDPDFPEDVYDSIPDEVIDQILELIASKMPEYHSRKKLHEMYKEDKITYETYSRELAVTDILDQVISILKGGTDE
jgi:predicted AAA+ superfamily ATPase